MLMLVLFVALPGRATEAQQVIKVLPHLLDKQGRHALSPSLFDRDAYQAWLRARPAEQSGIRYDVQWKSLEPGKFTLQLELVGRVDNGEVRRKLIKLEVTTKSRLSQWSGILFGGDDFKKFGPIVAWRVSLWRDGKMVAKQQSFLWE